MATFNGTVDKLEDNRNKVDDISSVTIETESTKYPSVKAVKAHVTDNNNPHNVTAEQLGLGNVENKSSSEILEDLIFDVSDGYYIDSEQTEISSSDYAKLNLRNISNESELPTAYVQFTGHNSVKCNHYGSGRDGYYIEFALDDSIFEQGENGYVTGINSKNYLTYYKLNNMVFCKGRISDLTGSPNFSPNSTYSYNLLPIVPAVDTSIPLYTVGTNSSIIQFGDLNLVISNGRTLKINTNENGGTATFQNIYFWYFV